MTTTLEKPAVEPPELVEFPNPKRRHVSRKWLTSWIGVALLLAAWQLVPNWGIVDKTFLPPLDQVLDAWWNLATSGELWTDVHVSLQRSLTGFGIALGVGIPVGLFVVITLLVLLPGWVRGDRNRNEIGWDSKSANRAGSAPQDKPGEGTAEQAKAGAASSGTGGASGSW